MSAQKNKEMWVEGLLRVKHIVPGTMLFNNMTALLFLSVDDDAVHGAGYNDKMGVHLTWLYLCDGHIKHLVGTFHVNDQISAQWTGSVGPVRRSDVDQ
jgi:hypothetical protein